MHSAVTTSILIALLTFIVPSLLFPVREPHSVHADQTLVSVDWSKYQDLTHPGGIVLYSNTTRPIRLPALDDVDKIPLEDLVSMNPPKQRRIANDYFHECFAKHKDVKQILQPLISVKPEEMKTDLIYAATIQLRKEIINRIWNSKMNRTLQEYFERSSVPQNIISDINLATMTARQRDSSNRNNRKVVKGTALYAHRRLQSCKALRRFRARRSLQEKQGPIEIPDRIAYGPDGSLLDPKKLETIASTEYEHLYSHLHSFVSALIALMKKVGYTDLQADSIIGWRSRRRFKNLKLRHHIKSSKEGAHDTSQGLPSSSSQVETETTDSPLYQDTNKVLYHHGWWHPDNA